NPEEYFRFFESVVWSRDWRLQGCPGGLAVDVLAELARREKDARHVVVEYMLFCILLTTTLSDHEIYEILMDPRLFQRTLVEDPMRSKLGILLDTQAAQKMEVQGVNIKIVHENALLIEENRKWAAVRNGRAPTRYQVDSNGRMLRLTNGMLTDGEW